MHYFLPYILSPSAPVAVFVNKILMDPSRGFGFVFATSLCSLHFFASGAFVRMSEALGYGESKGMPMKGKCRCKGSSWAVPP